MMRKSATFRHGPCMFHPNEAESNRLDGIVTECVHRISDELQRPEQLHGYPSHAPIQSRDSDACQTSLSLTQHPCTSVSPRYAQKILDVLLPNTPRSTESHLTRLSYGLTSSHQTLSQIVLFQSPANSVYSGGGVTVMVNSLVLYSLLPMETAI